VGEWVLEALLEAGFRRRGAEGPSFPTIVGSGANATVLHYTANSGVLAAGQVVLVDAGARADRYCSDITRCYPVAGRFTPAQQALFDVVKEAHDAAVAAAVAGAPVSGLHDAAVRVLVAGLVELRLLQGDPTALLGEPERWKRFYPHRTSHWLGLEVHDAGTYTDGENPRLLEPGMVLTVEPGLYVPVDATGAPAELRGTGIRLEDDVLVTSGAPEVLTAALPLQP
jgi:Xaa-Pro aminopeptidase